MTSVDPAGPVGTTSPVADTTRPPGVDTESDALRISRVVLLVVVAVVALGGLLIRVWILGHATMNSDEATVGLIAKEALRGHTNAFYWGQTYGGVEPYVVAALSALFGQSPLTVNATPTVLAVVVSVLVWRIGLRLFTDMAAVCAAALSWIWAESSLWNSTRELGLHQICSVLGCVVFLQTLRIIQGARTSDGERIADWLILGLAAGLGFWASPEIVYLALPCAIAVLISLRLHTLRAALIRVACAGSMVVVGCLPWLWATVGGRVTAIPQSPVGYFSRLTTFFTHILPMLLGVRVEGAGTWEGGSMVGKTLFLLLFCLLVAAMVIVVLRTADGWIPVAALAMFPFLYAAFPTSWFWNDGRYAAQLTTLLSLVLIGGLFLVLRPPLVRWAACLVLLTAFASTLVAFDSSYGAIRHPSTLTTGRTNPNTSVLALAHGLSRLGISHAYAGYWLANDLTFISGGTVVADNVGFARNPPEAASVLRADRAAWIFVDPTKTAQAGEQLGATTQINPGTYTGSAPFIAWLDAHGIAYHQYSVDIFDIVVPVRNVTPGELSR